MRVSGGTIVLIVIALPFIAPFVYYVASLIKAFTVPDIGVPEAWYTTPYFIAKGVFDFLRRLLSDPRVLAALLGLGLIVGVLSTER